MKMAAALAMLLYVIGVVVFWILAGLVTFHFVSKLW
jgi:hypothetical protein